MFTLLPALRSLAICVIDVIALSYRLILLVSPLALAASAAALYALSLSLTVCKSPGEPEEREQYNSEVQYDRTFHSQALSLEEKITKLLFKHCNIEW